MSGIMQQIDKYNKLIAESGDAASKATKEHIKLRDSLEDQSKAVQAQNQLQVSRQNLSTIEKMQADQYARGETPDVGQNNMLYNAKAKLLALNRLWVGVGVEEEEVA